VESARLWYDKLTADLKSIGFAEKKADKCVLNRAERDGSQTTVVIHVDDLLVTAKTEQQIDKLLVQLGDLGYNKLDVMRGKTLQYLGMVFDFTQSGKLKISMPGYTNDVLDFFSEIVGKSSTPAAEDLFKVDSNSPALDQHNKDYFHSGTAKLLYMAKRARPDILTAISFLARRVQQPTQQDLSKLIRVVQYLRSTAEMGLTLEADENITVYAYVDASYGVHSDMRSHTGAIISIGKGAVYSKSSVQKLNTKSSTEAELVGLSDASGQVLWTKQFLEEQGYKIGAAKIFQDNKSTIQLIANGQSNNERTRHIAIRFFYLTDKVKQNLIKVEYMPTSEMIADFLTKPLQGQQFKKLRAQLLN
jgi:hypothetical protein